MKTAMTSEELLSQMFDEDYYCGADRASDKGYWLEKADPENYEYLFSWREKAGL